MDITKLKITKDVSIKKALEVIECSTNKIAIVVSENQKVIGTVTDGDIRRGLLSGKKLDDAVLSVMNAKPILTILGEDLTPTINEIKRNLYRYAVIVTREGELHDVVSLNDIYQEQLIPHTAVIMAGGEGKRLGSVTQAIPKPMVEIAGKPMVEHLIERLRGYNYKKLYIAVKYKKEIIKEYFKDGKDFGVEIEYLEEKMQLGTAGSLSLLPDINEDFLVINSDLVTTVNLFTLKNHHQNSGNIATICVREYEHQVPFGVVEIDDRFHMKDIVEKPTNTAFVSSGIYAFKPDVLRYIPYHQYLDMPDLFKKLKDEHAVGVFPIFESWYDVGRMEDLNFVRNQFNV